MSFENVKRNGSLDYMLRTTQQHHVQLSNLADQKANIMIASTSILLTFAFTNFRQQNLFWGFLALFIFSFVSLILAIIAVSPRFGRQKDDEHNFNVLFFGHFTQMPLDQYYTVMENVMSSDANMYTAIVKDIYDVGTAIGRHKYRFLGYSYRVFLAGIVTAGVLFMLQTALFFGT